ncbi:ATP-binding protein [Actinacidiphila acididurans]|uniref:ATP-binding protein n=1 Tax=Actinacidiphila acididurans TaxID=2784346 RepID=A0ABS2TWT5_9ACTN|nr:ATP-binding protein [Actinacidiphila acididurans]MBM9507808.1 ATP-binding protein [Actinacidiphila acididurans]
MTTEPNAVPCVERIKVGAVPSAAAMARIFVRQALRTWNLDRLGDDAELVVSELVTNAVKATEAASSALGMYGMAADMVVIEIAAHDDTLRIAVEDSSRQRPALQVVDGDAEGGRGLFLVEALCIRWDALLLDNGKVTWAELPLTPGPGA